MWFFMWFCKKNVEKLVMFEITGCFDWLLTFVEHTKAFWTLNAQETLIYNDCTFCGKLFKTIILQNHERNHTNCQFSTKRSDPLHLTFGQFFWLEWFLMGQRTACLVSLIYFPEKWALWNTLMPTLGSKLQIKKLHQTSVCLSLCASVSPQLLSILKQKGTQNT